MLQAAREDQIDVLLLSEINRPTRTNNSLLTVQTHAGNASRSLKAVIKIYSVQKRWLQVATESPERCSTQANTYAPVLEDFEDCSEEEERPAEYGHSDEDNSGYGSMM